jgi:hypothetical protein
MSIVSGLFAIVCLAAIVLYVLAWTDFFGDDLQLHMNMPGQFEFSNTGTLEYEDGITKVQLVEATAKLHFIDTPLPIARKLILILIGVCAFGMYIIWTFRQFVADVRGARIFTISNILSLQNISYAILGLWVYTIVFSRVAFYYLKPGLDIENVEIVSEFNNYPWMLMAALFLWVLSHILIRGLKLKQEQDLTI